MTDTELAAVEERWAQVPPVNMLKLWHDKGCLRVGAWQLSLQRAWTRDEVEAFRANYRTMQADIPDLLAEVRRLRALVTPAPEVRS